MNYGRVFVGLVLVTLGVLFGLDTAEIIDAGETISEWWPLAVIVGAGLMWVSNPRHWPAAGLVGLIGLALLTTRTGLVEASIWQFLWPLVLVVVGLALLLPRRRRSEATDENRVSSFVMFSGSELASRSDHFEGGDVTALFGGTDLDLRDATPAPEATLDVLCAFGGVEIRVPEGWQVRAKGFPIFGGFENATTKDRLPADAPTLDINATVLFGGVEIKH